jgi:tripartite-type tricarboxylate transporter receptor subunit TctC
MTLLPNSITRRGLLKRAGTAALALTLPGTLGEALAAAPKKLEVIIGFAPGGGTDRSVRVITPAWLKAMGITTPPQYTYAPGAGTVIATNQLLRGRSDGSLVNAIPSPYTAWSVLLKRGNYTLDDLAWVGGYFDDPNVLLVGKSSKYDTIDQFIEDARKRTEPFTVAVSAPMSASHAATVVLRELTKANLKVVPFDGGGPARNAVAGGHVDACLAPYWSAVNVLELTKAIGIFADENPAPELWQPVSAKKALGIDLPDLVEPYCMQVSAKTAQKSKDTYAVLVDGLRKAVADPETKEEARKAQRLDLFLKYRTPEECAKFVEDYLALLEQFHDAMKRDLDKM